MGLLMVDELIKLLKDKHSFNLDQSRTQSDPRASKRYLNIGVSI